MGKVICRASKIIRTSGCSFSINGFGSYVAVRHVCITLVSLCDWIFRVANSPLCILVFGILFHGLCLLHCFWFQVTVFCFENFRSGVSGNKSKLDRPAEPADGKGYSVVPEKMVQNIPVSRWEVIWPGKNMLSCFLCISIKIQRDYFNDLMAVMKACFHLGNKSPMKPHKQKGGSVKSASVLDH